MSDRRILLADDSPTIQKVVNLTFADEGIDVVCASDGDTAFQMISQFVPDLVLADVNMPGKTGYELCEAIRGRDDTKDTPVILLVGSFEPFDEEKALQVGANDYITKPFQSIRQLVNTVSELIKRPETGPVAEETGPAPEIEGQAGTESSQPTDAPEHDDIESLYRQSFLETVEIPREENSEFSDLGDAGLDDELIETEVADSVIHDDSGILESEPETTEILSPIDTGDFQFTESDLDPLESIRFEDTIREEYPATIEEPPSNAMNLEAAPNGDAESYPEPLAASEEVTRDFEIIESPVQMNGPESNTPQAVPNDVVRDFGSSNVLDLPLNEAVPVQAQPTKEESDSRFFSQEMIDELADRVADRVSASLARHLAQQVVPEVMRLIEEDRKKDG